MQIKTIIASIHLPNEDFRKSISQINNPNEILKQLVLLDKYFYPDSEAAIEKFFETGLINIDNIKPKEIGLWNFKDINNEDILTLVKLKNIEGFNDSEVQNYIYNKSYYLPYLAKSLQLVLNDPNIKVEDRIIFTNALAEREYKMKKIKY